MWYFQYVHAFWIGADSIVVSHKHIYNRKIIFHPILMSLENCKYLTIEFRTADNNTSTCKTFGFNCSVTTRIFQHQMWNLLRITCFFCDDVLFHRSVHVIVVFWFKFLNLLPSPSLCCERPGNLRCLGSELAKLCN